MIIKLHKQDTKQYKCKQASEPVLGSFQLSVKIKWYTYKKDKNNLQNNYTHRELDKSLKCPLAVGWQPCWGLFCEEKVFNDKEYKY